MADDSIYGFNRDNLTEMVRQILTEIPSSLPANGGNADTVGGKSADDFIRRYGAELLTVEYVSKAAMDSDYKGVVNSDVAANIGLDGSKSCWWHIIGLKNLNNDGYGTQIAIPLFPTTSMQNPKYRTSAGTVFQSWIDVYTGSNKPYIVGDATVKANSSICVPEHGFIPSAVFWWENLMYVYAAASFDSTSFTINSSSNVDRNINYIIFK